MDATEGGRRRRARGEGWGQGQGKAAGVAAGRTPRPLRQRLPYPRAGGGGRIGRAHRRGRRRAGVCMPSKWRRLLRAGSATHWKHLQDRHSGRRLVRTVPAKTAPAAPTDPRKQPSQATTDRHWGPLWGYIPTRRRRSGRSPTPQGGAACRFVFGCRTPRAARRRAASGQLHEGHTPPGAQGGGSRGSSGGPARRPPPTTRLVAATRGRGGGAGAAAWESRATVNPAHCNYKQKCTEYNASSVDDHAAVGPSPPLPPSLVAPPPTVPCARRRHAHDAAARGGHSVRLASFMARSNSLSKNSM